MRAQQFARRLVEHRFDKAFRFAQRYGLAVADEGEFADLDLISGFLCLGFRQADAGDLGMAISAARDVVPIHRMGMRASDMFDRNNAFMRSEEHTSELQSLMRISYAV